MRRFTSEGGTKTDYLSRYLRSPAKSTSSVSISRLRSDSSSWEKSLWNPEEQDDRNKRGVEQSAPTHACHTHCTPMQLGTTADQRYDVHRDWLWEHAKWQGYVEEPAAKDFVARKVCTIKWNKVQGTSWNAIRCKEHLQSHPAAVVRQATINLIHELEIPSGFLSRAVLRLLSGGLCHGRKCQFEDLGEKKRYDLQLPNGRLHKKSLEKGRTGTEFQC